MEVSFEISLIDTSELEMICWWPDFIAVTVRQGSYRSKAIKDDFSIFRVSNLDLRKCGALEQCALNHLLAIGWRWRIKLTRETTNFIPSVGGSGSPCVLVLCGTGARVLLPPDPLK